MYQGALSSGDVATLYNAATLDASTVTTPGITPVMLQNFETVRANPYALEQTTDVTGAIQVTPKGYFFDVTNDSQRGEVVDFTGEGKDYITFEDPSGVSDLNPGTGSYSVSLWFNASSEKDGVQILAHKGNQGSTQHGWNIHMIDDALYLRATSTNSDRYCLTTSITRDEWHHIAMVIDNENGLLKAYLDGESSEAVESIWGPAYDGNTFFTGPGTEFTTDDPIVEGARYSGDTIVEYEFDGMLDDFAVWNRALSEIEVLDIYGGASIVTPNDVAGDANSDGKVDGSDVTILAGNWQKGVSDGLTATWAEGDFNGDGKVDGSDVTILAGNWQYGVEAVASAVPEPNSITLLLSAIAGLLLLKRVK